MPLLRHTYNFPTRIEYGPGAIADLPKIIKGKGLTKGLLVTDQGIESIGLAEKLRSYFSEQGINIFSYSDVVSNPTEQNVIDATDIYKNNNCDFIVALGGGSPIDVGKTIKVTATHEEPLEKLDDFKGGDKYIVNEMPPFFAIPTTAGTGSEVGRSSVITVKSTNKKTIIFSPKMMPDIAVLDPEVTLLLPKKLTAATGVDAFVHNLEAYIMDTFHPYADAIAKEAISRCFKYLPIVVEDGNNVEARGEMLMASAMGATAFQKGLGINHSIAHALSVFYDTHHGLANAAVLVEVMKFNSTDEKVNKKLASLGTLLDTENNAESVISAIEKWLTKVGMPTDLKNIGVKEEDIAGLEAYAMEDPCKPLNPKPVLVGDVTRIIKNLLLNRKFYL
ncbi:MAG: iron-containing alcohol dehydrogenase [Ignavibacteriae bacterium]|nr:iron-containing alcohol dehydrogenase [Ignavibacteriota bacterium]